MTLVPPTLERYIVPRQVLEASQGMLRERGLLGLEAVVLWIGAIVDPTLCRVLTAVMPGQVAFSDGAGCAVEVPPNALSEVISWLPDGVFVVCRLHTHPGAAYHSSLDDTNMLISHNRAISIVVPDFAQDPLTFERCSVNELVHGRGWVELSAEEVARRFEIE